MLSAGDLDGDTYMVIWDQEITNGFEGNHEPSTPGDSKKSEKSKKKEE